MTRFYRDHRYAVLYLPLWAGFTFVVYLVTRGG